MWWENLFMPYGNNKGADQPAHPHSLISTFVIRCLDSIIALVSISKISSLYLPSVAAQASLHLPWLQRRRQVSLWRFYGVYSVCFCNQESDFAQVSLKFSHDVIAVRHHPNQHHVKVSRSVGRSVGQVSRSVGQSVSQSVSQSKTTIQLHLLYS